MEEKDELEELMENIDKIFGKWDDKILSLFTDPKALDEILNEYKQEKKGE